MLYDYEKKHIRNMEEIFELLKKSIKDSNERVRHYQDSIDTNKYLKETDENLLKAELNKYNEWRKEKGLDHYVSKTK